MSVPASDVDVTHIGMFKLVVVYVMNLLVRLQIINVHIRENVILNVPRAAVQVLLIAIHVLPMQVPQLLL
jgi:hypothetical protein